MSVAYTVKRMKVPEKFKAQIEQMAKDIESTALELYEHGAISDTIEGQIYMAYEVVTQQNVICGGELAHVFPVERTEH